MPFSARPLQAFLHPFFDSIFRSSSLASFSAVLPRRLARKRPMPSLDDLPGPSGDFFLPTLTVFSVPFRWLSLSFFHTAAAFRQMFIYPPPVLSSPCVPCLPVLSLLHLAACRAAYAIRSLPRRPTCPHLAPRFASPAFFPIFCPFSPYKIFLKILLKPLDKSPLLIYIIDK